MPLPHRSIRQALFVGMLCCSWFVLLTAPARAATPKLIDAAGLGAPVAPGSPVSYFDLLKLVFPGLHLGEKGFEAVASQTVPIRHIDGDYADTGLAGNIKFSTFMVLTIQSQKRPLLIMSIDMTHESQPADDTEVEEHCLLALFQPDAPSQLLDVLDIKADRLNGFWGDNPVIKFNSATDAFLVYNNHFNSNQNYTIVRMLFVHENRLQQICQVFFFDYRAECETYRSFPAFRLVPEPGQAYPQVIAAVTVRRAPSPPECRPRLAGFTKTYRDSFRWDQAKQQYRQTSGNLDKLFKFYEKYF